MPHKYVSKEVLERLRGDIANKAAEINSIKKITRGDKEGFDALLSRIKLLLESSKAKKDTAMDGLMEDGRPRSTVDGGWMPAPLIESRVQERMALIFRGEEKAFEAVLEMLTDSDNAVKYLNEEKTHLEGELARFEKMEVRDAGVHERKD